ncbi:MAG: hypothetical protein M1150_03540 [Patescibacteria group bacterium]|nr:hypothetical protein [Patescibacteria group bacterium]
MTEISTPDLAPVLPANQIDSPVTSSQPLPSQEPVMSNQGTENPEEEVWNPWSNYSEGTLGGPTPTAETSEFQEILNALKRIEEKIDQLKA